MDALTAQVHNVLMGQCHKDFWDFLGEACTETQILKISFPVEEILSEHQEKKRKRFSQMREETCQFLAIFPRNKTELETISLIFSS